jgi:hypothetical protein
VVSRRGQELYSEARLWDMKESPSIGGVKGVQARDGWNWLPLVQDRQGTKVIYGKVLKVDREMLLRVSLNAEDPSYSKWWRYPVDDNFYRLHKDDLAALATGLKTSDKIKVDDANLLFLVSASFWEEMKEKLRVKIAKDRVHFQFTGTYSNGEIVYEDPAVVIFKLPVGWPPTAPQQPSLGAARLYPDGGRIYYINKNHLNQLIANKVKVKEDEIDRVFVISKSYYNFLFDDKLIKTDGNKLTFFHELIRADILTRDDDLIVFRMPENYCHFPGEEVDEGGEQPRKIAPYWHEGYISLKIGQKVQDALLRPLSAKHAKDILHPPPTVVPTTPSSKGVTEVPSSSRRNVYGGRRLGKEAIISEGD